MKILSLILVMLTASLGYAQDTTKTALFAIAKFHAVFAGEHGKPVCLVYYSDGSEVDISSSLKFRIFSMNTKGNKDGEYIDAQNEFQVLNYFDNKGYELEAIAGYKYYFKLKNLPK